MDERPRAFPPDAVDARRWMGRLLIAVIVGEGIWNLIVSLMNNVVVPWIGYVLGPSSGLPASFIQRPYDYPDLFVAILELCLAGLVAVAINYFFQRPVRVKVKVQQRPVPQTSVSPATVVSPAPTRPAVPVTASQAPTQPSVAVPKPIAAPSVEARPAPSPVAPPAPVVKPTPAPPAPTLPAPTVKAVPVPQPASAAKPKQPKKVYYNSVGEPIEFDDE
ncbi:MAG TPA: hypothetical protein VFA68_05940 [Terriglobales bacterium]|nr:hypothetical protein [Terriglobales bacterium]